MSIDPFLSEPQRSLPAVSIGMPVFNDEKYVRAAIESLLAQTFDDFELLISDNGSTDGTAAICQAYAEVDPRVRYVCQPENRGQAGNFNYLLQTARCEFFIWAASDDVWDPTFIETLHQALKHDPSLVFAFCPYAFTDEAGQPFGDDRSFDYSSPTRLGQIIKLCRQYDDGCFYGLYRTRAIQSVVVPTWWGINKKTPYNLAYPVLFHALAAGRFVFAGERALWFNRLKPGAHYQPFGGNRLKAYLAAELRRVNVMIYSLGNIRRASGSTALAFGATLPLAGRLLVDSLRPLTARVRRSRGAGAKSPI